MNTLDDLRATLAVHAAGEDAGLADRAASVRSRVRVVRRRRRISAVAGAVTVIAVVAAGVALPGLLSDGVDAGLAAAPSVAVGGFDYDLVQVVDGDPGQTKVTASVPVSGRDTVAVLVADHLDGGTATLRTPFSGDRDADRLLDDGAGWPVTTPGGAARTEHVTVEARAHGGSSRTRIGIALYRRTDAMPKGVVDPTGQTVFRRQVGDRRLLAAAFVRPGQAEQTIRFTGALADVRLDDFCSVPGHPDEKSRPWLHVSVDDAGFTGSACGSPREDASTGGGSYALDQHEVKEHTARVWISPTERGAPAPVRGVVAGVAVYSPGATREVHGSTVDEVVEFDGRSWQLDDVIDSDPGTHRIVASWTGLRDHLLVGYAVERTRRVTTGGSIQGGEFVDGTAEDVADARSSSLGGVVLPGHDASFTVGWPSRYADASGAILVYRPLD